MTKLINIIENPSNKDNIIIFNLIKNNDTSNAIKMLEDNKISNLNIKDEHNNYLIHYIVNYNNIILLKACLKKILDWMFLIAIIELFYSILLNLIILKY